jgi:mono/diheme cytochrome c family protein
MSTISKTAAVVVLAAAVSALPGQEKKPAHNVWEGVYTAEQAARGMETFKSKCSGCHGENMAGGPGAPAAGGPEFVFNWDGKTAAELLDYLRANMPPNEAGSLSDERYADVAAAIFQTSEFPAGKADLPTDGGALGDIQITKDKPQQ